MTIWIYLQEIQLTTSNLTNMSLPPPTHVANSKFIEFDIADAETDRFIDTMRMPVNPMFKVSLQQIIDFVYTKRPTLKYRKIQIEL